MRPRHRIHTLLVVVALAATMTAATPSAFGRPMGATAPAPPGGVSVILIHLYTYVPARVVAGPGAVVVVLNTDRRPLYAHNVPHTVTANNGSFKAKAVPVGSFRAPLAAGRYGFHCSFHPSMRGVLVVPVGAPGIAPPAPRAASGTAPTAPLPGGVILIDRFHFLPPILPAVPGTTIVVVNLDYERLTHPQSHTVTALDGSFDTVAAPTGTFRVPGAAGLYPWHCRFHHRMKGLLIVG